MRRIRPLFGLLVLALSLAPSAAPAARAATCEYRLGFADLHALIPETVGNCVSDESHNPQNGDALQQTDRGLLVWRKADNWTAFTDGSTTWINGPNGLQSRPNDQRFPWEPDAQPAGQPSADEGCRADPLAGVYRPERLQMLNPCQQASGTVASSRRESDGDTHVDLTLDAGQDGLLCDRNATAQPGALVLEIIPGDAVSIPVPSVGDHIAVTGAWVKDTVHDWCELHPVWSLTVGGRTYFHSAPDLSVPIPGESDEEGDTTPGNSPAQPGPGSQPQPANGGGTSGGGSAGPDTGPFVCADGTTSQAAHRQGACSHHGGIAPGG